MARRKKSSADQTVGVGLTTRNVKKNRSPFLDILRDDIEPLSDNQKTFFDRNPS